jgi:hypothetical protein
MSSRAKCKALTKTHNPCKNYAQEGTNFCQIHQCTIIEKLERNEGKEEDKHVLRKQCAAETKEGTKCKNKTMANSKFCYRHQEECKINSPRNLIPDLENIVSEYTYPNDYAKLIKENPSKYSWDKYYKSKDLPDLKNAIESDNLSLVTYLFNKGKRLEYLDFYLDIKSTEMLKFIIKNFKPNDEEYSDIINQSFHHQNYNIIEYIMRYTDYKLSNYNFGQYFDSIIYSKDLQKIKFFVRMMKKAYPNKEDLIEHLNNFLDMYDAINSDHTYIPKNSEIDKYFKSLAKEYKIQTNYDTDED